MPSKKKYSIPVAKEFGKFLVSSFVPQHSFREKDDLANQ